MDNTKVTILIPAYNPTEDLVPLVDGLIQNEYVVVVVNDGSKPSCNDIFNSLNKAAIILTHETNMGKGQALKTGFEYIHKNINCVGVITADADGQHILEDIINISLALVKNPNSLVLGSRFDSYKMPFKSRVGNGFTRFVFLLASTQKIFDTQTGLRGIPYDLLVEFTKIDGQRYEYEINMLLYCTQNNIDIKEIKIRTIYINNNKASSFNIVKDSIKIYKCIYNYSRLKPISLYIISGLLSFLIDYVLVISLHSLLTSTYSADKALLISVVVARITSSIFNFFFNKNIVFKDKERLITKLIKYYLLATVILTLNYILLEILTVKLSFNLKISKLFVELLLFIFSYLVQKAIIFKNNKKKEI